MKLTSLALLLIALPAAAEPQFVTLERADRESRIGLQGSLQFYPDVDDTIGLRTELFGQFAANLRGGGVLGGYGHLALGFLMGNGDDESALSNVELGGFYVTDVSARTDLVLHFGLSLPTASDDPRKIVTNALTALERHYEFINIFPDSTALRLGVTLRTPLGISAFLQGDLGADLQIDAPGNNDEIFHANLGIGAYATSVVIMAELALSFDDGDLLGSVALGLRFINSSIKPHIGYEMVFADKDYGVGDGIVAHMITFGFYAAIL